MAEKVTEAYNEHQEEVYRDVVKNRNTWISIIHLMKSGLIAPYKLSEIKEEELSELIFAHNIYIDNQPQSKEV